MFSIFRSQEAMAPLGEAWYQADADFQGEILRASQCLDRKLHQEPHRQGESRGGRVRILIEDPLAVLFEVDEARKLVRILRAWAFRSVPRRPDC